MSRVAIVTGGGRGVGRLIATDLARQGFAVAVAARTGRELDETAAMIEADGGRPLAHVADVTRTDEVNALVRHVEERLGAVELLVNNAGTAAAIGPTWEVEPDLWWRDVETSLRAAFLCTRATLPGMIARRRGRILNVSSYVGARPSPYISGYAAAKAALVSFTESLAAEVAEHDIRVFAITPGLFRSALLDGLMSTESRRWLPEVGTGRFVEPAEVARLVRFLASGAGDALAGRFLHALDDVGALEAEADRIVRDDLLTVRLRRFEPADRAT